MHSNKKQTNAVVVPIAKFDPRIHAGGGKAEGLKKITRAALRVPETWVVVSAEHDSVGQLIHDVIPPHATRRYAVRSSAIGEDGEAHSFAGMFKTVLDVPHEGLVEAVRDVVSSLSSPQTSQYQALRHHEVSHMSVVIQEMIHSDFAGVLFTESPVEPSKNVSLLEVVKGLGEQLVSGKVTPLSLRLNATTGMHRVIQQGAQQISLEECWFIDELLEGADQLRQSLDEPSHLDIEWCVRGKELYFLQSRPITTHRMH